MNKFSASKRNIFIMYNYYPLHGEDMWLKRVCIIESTGPYKAGRNMNGNRLLKICYRRVKHKYEDMVTIFKYYEANRNTKEILSKDYYEQYKK